MIYSSHPFPMIYNTFLPKRNARPMTPQSSLYIPNPLRAEQLRLLNSSLCLYDLFDRFQASNLFSIPQNSLVINLDNITFGPDRYTITTDNSEDISFKIIYYSLLYFIFQRKRDEKSSSVYQRLLQFIISEEIDVQGKQGGFTQEEVKVYLVKFLQILASGKDRRKIVIDELNNLPQIHVLFVELVKRIANTRVLKFEQNARQIQQHFAEKLGVKFDLLSCDLFLLDDQFQIQMRHFSQKTEFSLITDTLENITRIRDEHFMAESAYFTDEMTGSQLEGRDGKLMKGVRSSKVIKKSTIKSVEWDGGIQEDEEAKQKQEQICFNKKEIFCSFFPNGVETKQSDKSEDRTFVESQPQKPKLLTFHEIIKESTIKTAPIVPAQTVRSTLHTEQQISSSTSLQNRATLRKRFHKQSLQLSPFSTLLTSSFSTKCIKSEGCVSPKQNQSYPRRVPTFILNRAKAKNQKLQQILQPKLPPSFPSTPSLKTLKITFTYQ